MKKLLLILVACVTVYAANSRTASTLTRTGDPTTAREQLINVIPAEFNKLCYDIDTAFAHLSGTFSDSTSKTAAKLFRLYVSDSAFIDTIKTTVQTGDSTKLRTLVVSDSAFIDTLKATTITVSTVSAWFTEISDSLFADTAKINKLTVDSAFIDGILVCDSLRVNMSVQTETNTESDKYVWVSVGGSPYKLLLKAP
jgi:hypothetical protein